MAEKEIPVRYQYDVVVLGGGTAGAIAGIAAAREGAKTLIVERYGCLGGSQTMALVTPIMPEGMKEGNAESSISKEIRKRLTAKGFAHKYDGNNSSWFDTEMLKVELEEMAIESGCDLLYNSSFVDAIVENSKVKAIVVANKAGLEAIQASHFIDCTGDGDLSVAVGANYTSGNANGRNQSVSLRFEMVGVDMDRFGDFLEQGGQNDGYTRYPLLSTYRGKLCKALDDILEQKCKEGYVTEQDIHYVQLFSMPGNPTALSFNCPELGDSENAIDPVYMTKKYIEGKQSILRLVRCFQQFIPGFEKSSIGKIAPMLGVRESRNIEAEYRLCIDDVMNYCKFDDAIAMSDYEIDVHGAKDEALANKKYNKSLPLKEQFFTIPFRSLVVKGLDNLFVAGRCAGFDFYVQSTVRVQHTCRYMGEAAGIGAAIAAKENKLAREVDGVAVREKMKAYGSDLI